MAERVGFGTPLYSPDNAKVDVVFVHGLGGHRINTWTSEPTKKIPVETFWPEELLPKACPTARILSFGYDSRFVKFFPLSKSNLDKEGTIDEYSTALYQNLASLRESTKTPADRPIIYVAHSLGGLVVANAVSRPPGANETAQKLTDNTIGMIFLGTPFAGSDKASWGEMAAKFVTLFGVQTKDTDIKDLNERSARLIDINLDFDTFIKGRDRDRKHGPVEIVCYYEADPTFIGPVCIGKVVSKESAARLPAIAALSIPDNHSDMCKFAGEFSSGYASVSGQLAQWITALDKRGEEGEDHAGSTSVRIDGVVNNKGVVTGVIKSLPGGTTSVTGSADTTYNFGPLPDEAILKLMGKK
ncbi:uncharacterized protein CC84DRAFT_1163034 [Paraphaeosphaeria sporulosa]|uniref:DUF676 domain-containing protein n=1 Tax=Paraphaeosphaeria sporulosa TaxID=1460663 RepID=A0A177CIQ6_9PLEO|nr:uncharacterized protein CC84DRAFT_1163034 [Paraphaeosphaeria sporulosa]OAG06710.1 hypothetical protein CC84DRAFT_1163034 [Paraphaeosphaeria sporulosa]